jgi:hypothetical protein
MSSRLLGFGETLPGYTVPMLNERAVRAGAGILFFFAIVSFMHAWLLGNFQPTRVFVVALTSGQIAGPGPPAAPLNTTALSATPAPVDAAQAQRCKVPEFAKALGHEDKWKLHNNCR